MSDYPETAALETWETDGVSCSIVRQNSGHLCGYARFPSRPVRETGYRGILSYVPVHGGITYAKEEENGTMLNGSSTVRTYRVMKATLLLFVCGMAVATLFVAALRVQAAFAAPEKAVVSRAFHKMTIRGQVKAKRQAHRVIRRQRAELRRLRSRSLPVYGSHPVERNMLCIHGGEGSWNSATGNGYYGGMQMNEQFAKTYGRWAWDYWGTPDHWPISVQLSTSIQAMVSGRGYHPWPTTARRCGLIT